MILRFTKNIAINTQSGSNGKLTGFYQSLGLESRETAPDFAWLGPSPYSCFVVSWEPAPQRESEICLQFETDDIGEVKVRAETAGAEVLYFGQDRNRPELKNLWFRDPGGNLINVTELS